ncbi:tRNA (guanosine(37)-N1)-methyltransferase TrmD [Candidatus Epulonipiscium viviparus]|uniref:tRNA (guanosine(37)-N1)-methyltransferase TrmD n=1 Tax=Candidatus Epulonipiscium viviparus TaxID=420336 RepID=UPI0027380830|nr:tRNA (guanosine(37)-N1)-methyltransferase TrmD [Candidatus Epulopiscium viviparus]
MKIVIMTLFPEMIEDAVRHSIMGRAIENGLIQIEAVDFRAFSGNKHNQVDDYPYGGGAGMLIMAKPVVDCYRHIAKEMKSPRVMYMTPAGKVWNQEMAIEYSKEEEVVILCGHYEGIDQRAIEAIVTDEVSIGDFILTGGELAAMVVADSIIRLLPNVLGKEESFEKESFSEGLLEHDHYTRPQNFEGREVPEVLLSGNHKNIEMYRRENSLLNTLKKRPDLLKTVELAEKDKKILKKYNYF